MGSKDPNHDSMYIAAKEFTATKVPSLELDQNHWVEFKAPEGKQGIPGNNGVDGKDGNNGHDGSNGKDGKDGRDGRDGTGLTLKTFVKDQTYNKGDYVFAPSSKDPKHDSMYIAEKAFTALKSPSEELDKNHWVEFKAPEGKQGKQGIPGKDGTDGAAGSNGKDGANGKDGTNGKDGINGKDGTNGVNGKDGRDGHDGTGLTLKTFTLQGTYNKGDYVFAPSSKDPNHDSMYIAAATFTAAEFPSKELDKHHWIEFKAPEGKDGKQGTPGTNGKDGTNGHDGKAGKDGNNGHDGKNGADGKDGTNGKDGVNGINGAPGIPGANGKDGANGANGKDGRNGHDGTGLTLKTFVKDQTYNKGDYVFAPSSKDPKHDSMYIA